MENTQSQFSPQKSAQHAPELPLLHTVSETCALLSISQATAYRMIAAGSLVTVQLGRRRLVKAESIRQLAERGTK